MSRRAFIIAARRTAVAPRGGAFAKVEAHDLAAPVLRACLEDAGLSVFAPVDHVILGNGLSGGGNVARLCALAANLPEPVSAITIDRQCCSGLDAIALAARMIESGAAEIVLAGGVESWSRAPLRARRPKERGEEPVFYDCPAFTPWPACDPDMLQTAARLAEGRAISRYAQAEYAVNSHRKALAARTRLRTEIVSVAGLADDAFARALTSRTCLRAPVLAGAGDFAIDASGVAVEADAAAVVLVVSEQWVKDLGRPASEIYYDCMAAGDPESPAAALEAAVRKASFDAILFDSAKYASDHRFLADWGAIAAVELMEAFAAQALANVDELGLDMARVNVGGGALARGHPIGASGAILAVRLFHELAAQPAGALGLAAIAAAGGLGSALVLQRS